MYRQNQFNVPGAYQGKSGDFTAGGTNFLRVGGTFPAPVLAELTLVAPAYHRNVRGSAREHLDSKCQRAQSGTLAAGDSILSRLPCVGRAFGVVKAAPVNFLPQSWPKANLDPAARAPRDDSYLNMRLNNPNALAGKGGDVGWTRKSLSFTADSAAAPSLQTGCELTPKGCLHAIGGQTAVEPKAQSRC